MKNRGFTLIELILFIALFSILLSVLTDIITTSLNIQLDSQAVSSVEQDGRFILSRIGYDILRSQSISQPSSLGSPGTNTLNLSICSGASNYSYHLSGTNLVLDGPIGNGVPLNSYDTAISNLTFTRIGTQSSGLISTLDNIQLSFLVTGKSIPKSGPKSKNFTTTIGLRCYNEGCQQAPQSILCQN